MNSNTGGVGPSLRSQEAANRSQWLAHMRIVRMQHPELSWGDVAKLAHESYEKQPPRFFQYKYKGAPRHYTAQDIAYLKSQTERKRNGLSFEYTQPREYEDGYPREYIPKKKKKVEFDETVQVKEESQPGGVAIYQYNKSTQHFLDNYGHHIIMGVTLCKDPIQKVVSTALNVLTLGKFKKAQEDLGYDEMYHVYALLHMDNGEVYFLEKNQTILIGKAEGTYLEPRHSLPAQILRQVSLNSLLDETRSVMGVQRFYDYRAWDWNCQDFLLNCLQVIGVTDLAAARDFLYQDTQKLFDKLAPAYRGISKVVTDIAGIYDHIVKK